jgi:hypothetical protein
MAPIRTTFNLNSNAYISVYGKEKNGRTYPEVAVLFSKIGEEGRRLAIPHHGLSMIMPQYRRFMMAKLRLATALDTGRPVEIDLGYSMVTRTMNLPGGGKMVGVFNSFTGKSVQLTPKQFDLFVNYSDDIDDAIEKIGPKTSTPIKTAPTTLRTPNLSIVVDDAPKKPLTDFGDYSVEFSEDLYLLACCVAARKLSNESVQCLACALNETYDSEGHNCLVPEHQRIAGPLDNTIRKMYLDTKVNIKSNSV